MKIVTVQFNYKGRSNYSLLFDVFKHSVKKHMPNVEFVEFCIPPPTPRKNSNLPLNFMYNGVKLKLWVDYLEKTDDNIIFADCDMMAIRNAEHAFDIPFDVAYTARTTTNRIPMNGGIMMARPTEKARAFFRRMLKINDLMYKDKKFHNEWRKIWAGMNQSAFGFTFTENKKTNKINAKVHEYKTIEWNAVDCDWTKIKKFGKTVFIHYKSKLRKSVLGEKTPNAEWRYVINLWNMERLELARAKRKTKK